MARKFTELTARLHESPEALEQASRARERLAEELEAYQHTLGQIRRAREMTQTQLAMALEVGEREVSRIEHQADLFVSTLRSYLHALGGDLQLLATFQRPMLHRFDGRRSRGCVRPGR